MRISVAGIASVVISAVVTFWLVFSSVNAASNSAPMLLVANKGDQTLGLVDPEAGKQVAVVAEGAVTGHEVVASPDGR